MYVYFANLRPGGTNVCLEVAVTVKVTSVTLSRSYSELNPNFITLRPD